MRQRLLPLLLLLPILLAWLAGSQQAVGSVYVSCTVQWEERQGNLATRTLSCSDSDSDTIYPRSSFNYWWQGVLEGYGAWLGADVNKDPPVLPYLSVSGSSSHQGSFRWSSGGTGKSASGSATLPCSATCDINTCTGGRWGCTTPPRRRCKP